MTAFTLIETLSRVITSWGGTSDGHRPQAHLTHLVDEGHQQHEPGPVALPARVEDGLGAAAEPEDDHALVLAAGCATKEPRKNSANHDDDEGEAASPPGSCHASLSRLRDGERQPVHADDAHARALLDRRAPGDRPPDLALNHHLPLGRQRLAGDARLPHERWARRPPAGGRSARTPGR